MSVELLLALVGTLLAALAAAASLLIAAANGRSTVRQREMLKGLNIDDALDTLDLRAVGDLIVRDLGGVSIQNYVVDSDVRRRFRRDLNGARRFIGESTETQTPRRDVDGQSEWVPGVEHGVQGLSEFGRAALLDVGRGEAWNALARMRRALEATLVTILRDVLGDDSRRRTAGQLMALASGTGAIAPNVERELRGALSVANRAIHGEEVSPDQSVEAVVVIDRFLTDPHAYGER